MGEWSSIATLLGTFGAFIAILLTSLHRLEGRLDKRFDKTDHRIVGVRTELKDDIAALAGKVTVIDARVYDIATGRRSLIVPPTGS